MCMSLQKPEECVLFLGAGVTGGCEPPDVGGRNGTKVLLATELRASSL